MKKVKTYRFAGSSGHVVIVKAIFGSKSVGSFSFDGPLVLHVALIAHYGHQRQRRELVAQLANFVYPLFEYVETGTVGHVVN